MDKLKAGNKRAKIHQHLWDVVQVETENHCNFVKLWEMLICTYTMDMGEQTHSKHYELYRLSYWKKWVCGPRK